MPLGWDERNMELTFNAATGFIWGLIYLFYIDNQLPIKLYHLGEGVEFLYPIRNKKKED